MKIAFQKIAHYDNNNNNNEDVQQQKRDKNTKEDRAPNSLVVVTVV